MKRSGFYLCLVATFSAFIVAIFPSATESYEFDRYVEESNFSFLLSETEELTCTCTGKHGEFKSDPSYYRRHFIEELNAYFDTNRPTYVICNKSLTFHPVKLPKGRFNTSVSCYSYYGVDDAFTAVEVKYNNTRLAWKTDDVGYFDFDGKLNASRAPCSTCGDRCNCSSTIVVFNMMTRDCCHPGVPFPDGYNDGTAVSVTMHIVGGLLFLLLITRFSAW